MMPPAPKVTKLNGELALLGEPEDDSVAAGREAFALLYQEVAALSAEVPPASPSPPPPPPPNLAIAALTRPFIGKDISHWLLAAPINSLVICSVAFLHVVLLMPRNMSTI